MNKFGKLLMTLAIAIYTFIPPLADIITDTHVYRADWMPHARMHTVWLVGVTSTLGLASLYLLWRRGENSISDTNIAAGISACIYGSFLLSAASMQLYGGALSDPHPGGELSVLGLDVNLFIFSIATMILGLGWAVCGRVRT